MKFKDVRTIESLLKEYGMSSGPSTSVGNQKSGSIVNKPSSSSLKKISPSIVRKPSSNKTTNPKELSMTTSKAGDLEKDFIFPDEKGNELKIVSPAGKRTSLPNDEEDVVIAFDKNNVPVVFDKNADISYPEVQEGKLGKLAKSKGRKLQIRNLKKIIKKLSKKRLKEQPEELFEINFNKKEIATAALDAPVKCGFEAETFFYSVEGGSSNDVDEMSISDIEYEYGDMPDQVWEDFEDWLYTKGQDEYLDDIIEDKVNEVREDEDYLNDFIDSADGPSSEAVERYKKDFEEEDPKEYENREEDGWEYINWVREYVEEEYEEAYLEWLRLDVREENDLDDEAREAARSDYSVEDWIYDNYSYMSSFLDDYGYEYGGGSGDVEGVADELMVWIRDNSEFKDYPESGDYGDTYTTTSWAVEKDSSIEPDEGTGAELISPVFDSPRKMLTEMKSLFDWSEENFGTNHSTGLHVTMSWQGEPDAPRSDDGRMQGQEQNKLKMALLLGDEYLLAEFGRLRNSYTKSQYRNILKYAEGMKRGDAKSFEEFEKMLTKGIDTGKMNSIHFKGETDDDSGNNLIEFRIAGGVDYNTMYEKVVKACVRYATIMKAGYDEDAFRPEYVKAVFRLLRKSQEIDPKKLKDLEAVNHEVIDSAKGIVGKKDYFDVIKLLSSSVEYLQNYEKLSSPDADKIWKQEIKDFEKNTGDNVEIEEVEQGEPIQGYMKPNSMSPSKRAAGELDKAQDRFGSAITLLARDIADGNNRAPVTAKNIGAFRKFAKELQLNTDSIEKLALAGMKNYNFDGTDKEKVARLQKGINSLFKQDIIKKPEFLAIKDVDLIGSKMWQFYQSDDSKDNVKLDKLADLLVSINPSNSKIDVEDTLRELSHQRTENGFVAKLKGSGWNTNVSLLKSNGITTKGSAQELLKFLEPYEGYKHPTSRDHHVNIKSDDKYSDVFQMRLTQRLRDRLDHLKDLEREDKEKYVTVAKQVSKLGIELLNGLKPRPDLWDEDENGYTQINRGSDGAADLASHDSLERWNDAMDRLVKADEEIGSDKPTFVFPNIVDDYVLASMHMDRYFSWKENNGPTQSAVLKQLHKERFAAIKKFLSGFDKIFQKEGFVNLKQEIQAKNTLDRRNRDFEKNVRNKARATFNIPSHSYVYLEKEFYDTLTDENYSDRMAYLDAHLEHFNDEVNTGEKVYVIPAAHMSEADDAYEGLELISKLEQQNNYYTSWRKPGYRKILSKFARVYNITYNDLTGLNNKKFFQVGGDEYQKLAELGIDITRKGDSRTGMPGQSDLIDPEELKNPISGEPINRGSATYWMSDDDKAKEEMRFKAFDWSLYPDPVKGLVAKELKGMKDDQGFYSFKLAINYVIDKIQKNNTGISLNTVDNVEGLINAAEVDGYRKDHSAKIGAETNWSKLADYLKIERGVNDQGVDLLKQTYNMYDNNTSGDFAAKGVSLERWVDAVQKSHKYITTNYTVSGGNYFRGEDYIGARHGGPDNADRTVSTPPEKEFNADYDKAREDYPIFDMLMLNGMQKFLARGEVNNLVAFLNNNSNDRGFKRAVLDTLSSAPESGMGAFDDFQSVLASARMNMSRQNQESVLSKFSKLPLAEQLILIEESEVLEKWSKKYKDSINCSNPKGFSQKAHCDGKKKQEGRIEDTFGTKSIDKHNKPEKKKKKDTVEESAVPDNSVIRILNKLLAEPMPASNLKKQMDAYFAIPDPKMLTDFRARRAEGGDDICLRPVLRSYVKNQLDKSLQKQINLNESKAFLKEYDDLEAEKIKIQDIINKLDIEDEKDREIIDQIWRILNSDHIQTVIGSVIARPIADETAMDKLEATKILTKVIYQVEGSYDKIKSFLDDLEKTGSAYDVDAIKKPINALSNVFKSDVGFTVFKTLLPYGVGSNRKGPGEFALAMLSDRVQLSDSTGDIKVDGDLVEVKASKSETSSGGGRLGMHGLTGDDATARLLKYENDIPSIAQHLKDPRNKTLGFGKFLEYLNIDLPVGDKRRGQIVKDLYTGVFIPKAVQKIAKAVQSSNQSIEIAKQYAGANYIDYVSKGKFDSLLAIDLYTGKTAYMKNEDEFIEFIEGPHSGSLGVSAVSSNSNPAEVFVQMKFKKGKV